MRARRRSHGGIGARSIVGSGASAATVERFDGILLLLALHDDIEQRENLLEDCPDLGPCSVLLRHLVSAGRYNWSPRGEAPSLLRVGAEWKESAGRKTNHSKI